MTTGLLRRNHGYLEGVGRLRLHYRTWEVASPRAGLMIVHGLGEHSGRYGAFAEAVAGFGFSSFALDLRGHGASEGRTGHVRRFGVFLQELDRFRREVQGLIDPDVPLLVLGHSMGGLIALRYLEEYDAPVSGGIIVSPWLATAVRVPTWKVRLAGVLNRILPALPMTAPILPEDLSHDPEIVRAYREDPLVHDRITPRMFAEISGAMGRAFERGDRIGVPLLFLLAGEDRLVETQRAVSFARSLRAADVTIRVFPGYYHEVLNETDRSPVLIELRDWVMARAG